MIRSILVLTSLLFMLIGTSSAQQADQAGSVQCNDGQTYCLSDDDLKGFGGKMLEYKHPTKPAEFGFVNIVFYVDGKVFASNAKSANEGTWEVKEGKLKVTFKNWGENVFRFIRREKDLSIVFVRKTGESSPNLATLTPFEDRASIQGANFSEAKMAVFSMRQSLRAFSKILALPEKFLLQEE